MEPLAPGTEDDVENSLLATNSKKTIEQQRLLAIKAFLPNHSFGRVFELTFPNGAEHWYCHLCECPVMGRVYQHEIGKRHSSKLQQAQKMQHSQGIPSEDDTTLQIAPGEPLPPGYEGKVQKVTAIEERLDGYNAGALLGLEYLLEIQEYDRDKEPWYLCLLCDKKGDPRTVIAHLGSYNHLCQRHYPTCYRALSPYMTKQYKRNWQIAVTKIAEAIEQKYGRLKPFPVDKETFEQKKDEYWDMINNGFHFSEKSGATFEELIDKAELTKTQEVEFPVIIKPSEEVMKRTYRKTGTIPSNEPVKKRSPSPPVVAKPIKKTKPSTSLRRSKSRSLSSVSTISSSELSDFNPIQKNKSFEKAKSPKRRLPVRSPRTRRTRSRSHSPFRNRPRSRPFEDTKKSGVMPWQRSDYMRPRLENRRENRKDKIDKYDEFKKLATAIENDVERVMKVYERNPEKHPQYNEEWKIFWNKRYKELQSEGKDPTNYDFKPEWIQYWHKRIEELNNTEMKTRKEALRKRLGLPEEPAPICFRITGKKRPNTKDEVSHKPPPIASEPDQDHEVIIIEDKDEDSKSSKRSHSPWESDSEIKSSRLSRDKRDSNRRSRDSSLERRSRDRDDRKDYRKSRDYYKRSKYVKEKTRDRERERERDLHYSYKKEIPDCYKPPPVMRDVTRQPVYTNQIQSPIPEIDLEENEEVNIVAVLRLLTALEEKLGSLGPKIIDLLAQALASEKKEANSSETLLDSEINCVLFETVKEKLKGQLLAELVDYAQEKAFKNAIKKIATLLHFAAQRKPEIDNCKPDPVKVPGVGAVDKAAIAKQIASALILQGKTDVTQAELEQLINAVVGMAEASRNSNKPITTASFVEQLTLKKPEEIKTTPPPNVSPLVIPDSCNMDGLSDSDLQTLLQNFKDLSTEEQHGLINYLKKLESNEPERVERLRKFVNLGSDGKKKESDRSSPFSSRLASSKLELKINEDIEENMLREEGVAEKLHIDSEDEEYSFEDVFKAATKNVKEKEEERKQREETKKKEDLKDTQAIIANLMGYISKNSAANSDNTQSLDSSFTQTLNNLPVNMENIANIVGSIHNLQAQNLIRDEKSNTSNIFSMANQKPDLIENQIRSNTPSVNPNIKPSDFPNQNQFSRYDCPSNPQMYNQNVFPDQNNIQYPPINSYRNTYQENVSYPPQNSYAGRIPPDRREYFDNTYHRGGGGYTRGGFNRPAGNFDRNW